MMLAAATPTQAATPTRTPTRTPTVTPTRTLPPTFSFGRRSSYPVSGVSALAAGDFNGDGRPDIAAIGMNDNGDSTVTIWYTQTDGTFQPQSDVIVSSGFLDAIAAGKLVNTTQGDKYDDLALLGEDFDGNAFLQVYANLGGSAQVVSFQPRGGALPVGAGPTGISVLDLVGDGSDNALAVVNSADSPGTVSLLVRIGSRLLSHCRPPRR